MKEDNWTKQQTIDQLKQLIRTQTSEIRRLKQSNQNWATSIEHSCGSEESEIRYLKNLNTDCIRGLESCILEITGILK